MVAPFRLLRWGRREDDAGFGQHLPHNPSDEVLDLDRVDVPSHQVNRVRPLPLAPFIGALAASRAAIDGWPAAARMQLKLFLADRAARASTAASARGSWRHFNTSKLGIFLTN